MQYYIVYNGQQVGPFTKEQLRAYNINAQTPVWYDGLPDWTPAVQIPDLIDILTPTPPPFASAPQPTPQYTAPAQDPQQYLAPPASHLAWAIVCTILCCVPFGIVAIVYASKVNSLWSQGLYDQAYDASRKARNWAIWSAVIGFIASALYVALNIAGTIAMAPYGF